MADDMLTPYTWTIMQLFEKNTFIVPVYQRPYSWGDFQVETLLNDIFDTYKSKEKNQGYYIGNMILHDKNEKLPDGIHDRYYVIDGQQRITTFMLLMLNLFSICSKRQILDEQYVQNLKSCIWKNIDIKPDKKYPALELNSIEKDCFKEIVDICFDDANSFMADVNSIKTQSLSEKHLVENLNVISDRLNLELSSKNNNEILSFVKYILEYIKFIVVRCKYNESKVFGMFESINSKGKPLDDIDLIKTAIFYELDEDSYDIYLKKWGQLIIDTDDNLYDYFYTYVKAFITFYRNSIKINNFKTNLSWKLQEHFGCYDLCDAYKKLIDDMVDKVKYYNMLKSVDEAYKLIHNDKFRFYYRIFVGAYYHPKPLFMRVLFEYDENILNKEDVVDIISEVTKFMMYSGLASKDMITMFATIMEDIYIDESIVKDKVIARVVNELRLHGISKELIAAKLHSMYTYDKNRNITKALLALCESIYVNNGKEKISYDKADLLLDKFETNFSLDHLLVQKPDVNDAAYYYYAEKNKDGIEILKLKDGNDFPTDKVRNGMIYNDFVKEILHKLGNLRIYYRDKNSGRQNTAIDLGDFGLFHTYQEIIDRENTLVNTIMNLIFNIPVADISVINNINKPKAKDELKVKDLFAAGELLVGDSLIIKDKGEDSKAILINPNSVNYNNQIMTINQWAKRYLGWKSVRIYTYVCKADTMETLDDIRKRIKKSQNN